MTIECVRVLTYYQEGGWMSSGFQTLGMDVPRANIQMAPLSWGHLPLRT